MKNIEPNVCIYCDEPILEGEHRAPDFQEPLHWECGVRSVVGGLNHLNGTCSCCGGTLPPDPKGTTIREAAKMAAQAFLARNPR